MARAKTCQEAITPGSDAVEKQMSDKLQFVAQSDKLIKHVGHQTASLTPEIGETSSSRDIGQSPEGFGSTSAMNI